jgi:hypothetical protein
LGVFILNGMAQALDEFERVFGTSVAREFARQVRHLLRDDQMQPHCCASFAPFSESSATTGTPEKFTLT